MTLATDTFANGTFQYFQTFIENKIGGSDIIFAVLIITLLIVLLLAIRLPPKFAFLFGMVGLVSFFATKIYTSMESASYFGGQYNWVFGLGVIITLGLIFYTIDRNLMD